MIFCFSFALAGVAAALAIPVTIFVIEIVAASVLPQRNWVMSPGRDRRPRCAVLVPAHNESTGLLPTLADISAQLGAADRLLVIADNCTDDTASVAAMAGAVVVVRNEPDRKGKGYALACGLCHLREDPPDTVIVVDADCRVADGAIDRLIAACEVTGRPVQGLFQMIAHDESPINFRVAEFAWRVKNSLRPLGLQALGLPCQLMGSGMAFPWSVIRSAQLASGSIVEDLKLGLDLALTGNPPLFCSFRTVTSTLPFSVKGAETQRLRWERGHIGMILTAAPWLIFLSVTRANFNLLALALDLAVPPLTLLGVLIVGMLILATIGTLLGLSSTAMLISIASLVGLTGGVFISWLKSGRDILPLRTITAIASYVIAKFPIYRSMISHRSRSEWIRTDRQKI
jgi:cellulose synthase/poly-beta-1,6-N-acetylglucosamine synthase-like glycosyltransferase